MSGSYPYGFAGWFVVDIRLLIFTVVVSLLVTVGTMSMISKGRKRKELLKTGVFFFVASVVFNILILNTVFDYPVFRIESFFPFP